MMLDTTKPVHLNYMNFDNAINQAVFLIDFWAEWCAPCKAQDPILEEIAGQLNGKALVGKVNVDDNRTLASKYGITSIPTMIIFKNGIRVYQFVGVQPKEKILNTLQKFI